MYTALFQTLKSAKQCALHLLCFWVVVLLLSEAPSGVQGGSLIQPLSGSAKASPIRAKRVFPMNEDCQGIYDRELFGQLEKVCDDCYNFYRKPIVLRECRKDCYNSEMFEACLNDLKLTEEAGRFKELVQIVAGKKK